jgi:tungstate transport system ATP-binding protein
MTQPAYHISQLEHCYNRHPVLSIHELSIKPAAITGLIGPNGSGKSTFLKLLAFIEAPVTGKISFQGKTLQPFADSVCRERITLLTQEPYLLKRSVADNIAYGLKVRGDTARLSESIEQALEWVGLDAGIFLKRAWYELSGGEAQRVALAARLVLKPRVLLLDEPTANVDADSAWLIKEASLKARQEWGTTLVIASHDWHWLYEICDEVLHFYAGRVFQARMMSFIAGSWAPADNTGAIRKMADGQIIRAVHPPSAGAIALVSSDAIRLCPLPVTPSADTNQVVGTLTRLLLEKGTGLLIVTVVAGRTTFTTKVARERIEADQLIPGKQVAVLFDVADVKWLDSEIPVQAR